MASPHSEKAPRTALDNQLSFKRLDTATTICCELFKWAALLGMGYFGYLSVGKLAGTSTFADIGVRVIGSVKVSDGIIFVLTAGGWAYGLGQRSLRRKHIQRTTTDKNELERLLDKDRTSSNLTSKGTTPPQDPKR